MEWLQSSKACILNLESVLTCVEQVILRSANIRANNDAKRYVLSQVQLTNKDVRMLAKKIHGSLQKVMNKNSYVAFTVVKATSTALLWLNEEYLQQSNLKAHHGIGKSNFLDRFSYVVKGNNCFDEVKVQSNIQLEADAEIYAAGHNAGGARVGNLHGFQVKGLGQNLLAGKSTNTWHSYGGNALSDGVLEVVYSNLLLKIMPAGAVRSVGLILTGEKNAFSHEIPGVLETTRGCLLVRESCSRPAHFFPVSKFCSKIDKKFKISEPKRIRKITNDLLEAFGGSRCYFQYLSLFLDKCAQQFSYAKVNRIFHGAMTSSNIGFDGKWLDLTRVSFGGSGINLGSENSTAIFPFYNEHVAPINFVNKLVECLHKYTDSKLDMALFAETYSQKLEYYTGKYIAALIGVSNPCLEAKVSLDNLQGLTELKALVWNAILSDKTKNGKLEESLRDNDPLIQILENGFLLTSENEGKLFLLVLKSAFEIHEVRCRFSSFVKLCGIKSLKKAYFSQVFFRPRVIKHIEAGLYENDAVSAMIDTYSELTNWIYEENQLVQILYKKTSFVVCYQRDSNDYLLKNGDTVEIFTCSDDLSLCLAAMDKNYFIQNGFDFYPYIVRMLDILRRGDQKTK